VVNFMPRLLYPQGKSPWYQLGRRLGGPQSWSLRLIILSYGYFSGMSNDGAQQNFRAFITKLKCEDKDAERTHFTAEPSGEGLVICGEGSTPQSASDSHFHRTGVI
jgi:hypothetical protein